MRIEDKHWRCAKLLWNKQAWRGNGKEGTATKHPKAKQKQRVHIHIPKRTITKDHENHLPKTIQKQTNCFQIRFKTLQKWMPKTSWKHLHHKRPNASEKLFQRDLKLLPKSSQVRPKCSKNGCRRHFGSTLTTNIQIYQKSYSKGTQKCSKMHQFSSEKGT